MKSKCGKIKQLICKQCNPIIKGLEVYFGEKAPVIFWGVIGVFVMLIFAIMASCSSPVSGMSSSFLSGAPSLPGSSDGGVAKSVGSFSWAGAVMMLLGAGGMITGLATKKASVTCLVCGVGIAGTPLLLAYVGQTILQWTAAGLALLGLSIVAAMSYRRWKRLMNENG